MSIKFIHFSDTHLGFSEFDIADEKGNNIREEDVYKSFSNVIDIIIERKPDFVIHAGDIFHRSSPTNKALIKAANELAKLSQAEIPFYMVAGNHDFPKSSFTTPIYDLYSSVIKGKVFYEEQYEKVVNEKYIIHALPHINNEQKFENEALSIEIKDKSKPNIFVTHLALPSFRNEEYGERVLPDAALEKLKDFDYTALGHWHKFNHVKKYGNAFYSGSTERFSLSETDYDKGIIEVTIDKEVKTEFIKIPTRNYFSLKVENCADKLKSEILNELKESINKIDTKESIVNIAFNSLNASQYYEITKADIEEILEGSFYFSYSKNLKENSEEILYDSESFDLKENLNSELAKIFIVPKEFEEVSALTFAILSEIEEEESNADN